MDPLIFTGIPVGLAFGFVLSRGRFCMNSAFRDIIVLKEYSVLKTVGVAILVELAGFAILAKLGLITISPGTFSWGANMLGGFVFGIGMVVAGGCASGITYRVGEGMVGAMSAVIGLIFAGLISSIGALHPFVSFLRDATRITLANGENLTVANVLGIPHYIAALVIAGVAFFLWAALSKPSNTNKHQEKPSLYSRIFRRGWKWQATGIAMSIVGIAAFYSSTLAGRSYPLAITGGYLTTVKTLIMGHNYISWVSILVLSTIVGALIAALVSSEFKLRAPAPKTLIQTFLGGCLMGFGAVCAGGCNITHILSGVPQLALSSFLSGAFIVLGCWAAAWWMFVRPMKMLGS